MKKSDVRASCWCVVINNPISADEENINIARQRGWSVEGQLEKGENGTPHYQLVVKSGQQRFEALKKAFPRAHIEVARNSSALEQYCKKEETRIGELKPSTAYVSQAQVWAWFGEYFDDYGNKHGGVEDEHMLIVFDKMINQKIREGFYVELIGTNPQIRSCIKNYGRSIANRERSLRQKTDRQTAENLVSDLEQNEETVQEEESDSTQSKTGNGEDSDSTSEEGTT